MEPARRHTGAVAGLVLMTVVWGGTFAAMKVALGAHLGVGALLTLRFALGALGLGAFLWALKVPMTKGAVKDGLVLGLVLTVIFWMQVDGLRYTSTSKSAFITGLYVIFTPLVSVLFRRPPRLSHGLGAGLATLGLYLLVHEPGRPSGGWTFGDSETLLCALGSGFHIVLTGLFSRRSSGWVLAFVQVSVVAVLSAGLTLLMPEAPLANGTRLGGYTGLPGLLLQPRVWVPLVYLGLLGTTLAFYLMSTLQRHLGATEAAVIYSLEPVFAALLAMTGWIPGIHEHLRGTQILGGAVILGAMLMAELAPRSKGAGRKDQPSST